MRESRQVAVLQRLRRIHDSGAELGAGDVGAWVERARLAVAAGYGDPSPQLERFDAIKYTLSAVSDSTPDSAFANARETGVRSARALIAAFIEDLEPDAGAELRPLEPGGREVFVVHGTEVGLREEVARLLERLDLVPIILKDQPDAGRTIIEKFEDHALRAGFAVVLLTADDFGHGSGDPSPASANRARQNVMLELGYFLGALGRSHTAALYQPGVELPSDIHGLLYIPVDGEWKLRLAKELRAAGLSIDLNRL